MKQDPYWFFKKWGFPEGESVPIDEIYERLSELEQRVARLEEENVGTTNELYRLENSLDARIDILAEHCRITPDV
jgi:predicted nuclease with TOPRIM domain